MLEQNHISGTRLKGTACGRLASAWTDLPNLEDSLKASGSVSASGLGFEAAFSGKRLTARTGNNIQFSRIYDIVALVDMETDILIFTF